MLAGIAPAAGEEAKPAAGEAAVVPPGEPPEMDTWYAQVLARSPVGLNVTHFWSKDRKLRAETVIAGRRIVTIVDESTYYAYDLLVRTGIAVQRAPTAIGVSPPRRRRRTTPPSKGRLQRPRRRRVTKRRGMHRDPPRRGLPARRVTRRGPATTREPRWQRCRRRSWGRRSAARPP